MRNRKKLRPVAYTSDQIPVIPANTKQTPLFPVWGHRNWSRSLSILNQTFSNPQFYTTVPVKHFVPFPCHNFLYNFSYLVNDCPICIFFLLAVCRSFIQTKAKLFVFKNIVMALCPARINTTLYSHSVFIFISGTQSKIGHLRTPTENTFLMAVKTFIIAQTAPNFL